MALAFTHEGALVIVLDEENVERITAHDPFDFNSAKVPVPLVLAMPLVVRICYATKAEQLTIQRMTDPDQLMAYLARGFKVTESDEQRGYAYQPLDHKPFRKQ